MINLTYKKYIRPKFELNCRVRAIKSTEWYDIGAEGIITSVDFGDDNKSICVSFNKGNYEIGGSWWGDKSDFIIIKPTH